MRVNVCVRVRAHGCICEVSNRKYLQFYPITIISITHWLMKCRCGGSSRSVITAFRLFTKYYDALYHKGFDLNVLVPCGGLA